MTSGLVKDPALWFTDGTIVLRAENTIFRVYSGILSQASSVFKDMIAIGTPQPEGDDDSGVYEGCPLVVMGGDTAYDLRVFLLALHDSSSVIQASKPSEVPEVVSILRLSTKYDVAHFRQRAVDALQKWYPPTLSAYSPISSSATPREDFPRHVLVANAASQTEAIILLPTALLFCCATADSRTLYDGVYVDGVHRDLRPELKRAVFIGRPLLMHAARTHTQRSFFYRTVQDRQSCKKKEQCDEFCKIYTSIYDSKDDPWMNPLHRLNWKTISSTCCGPCMTSWESRHKAATEEVWQMLPSYFDLPSWTVLEQRCNAA